MPACAFPCWKMAATWRTAALEQAELVSDRLRRLASSGLHFLHNEFGLDLGVNPELWPSWVILSAVLVGLLLAVWWVVACGGATRRKRRTGARETSVNVSGAVSATDGGKTQTAKTARTEEPKKKNKKKASEKQKTQPNGRTVAEPREEIKAVQESPKQATLPQKQKQKQQVQQQSPQPSQKQQQSPQPSQKQQQSPQPSQKQQQSPQPSQKQQQKTQQPAQKQQQQQQPQPLQKQQQSPQPLQKQQQKTQQPAQKQQQQQQQQPAQKQQKQQQEPVQKQQPQPAQKQQQQAQQPAQKQQQQAQQPAQKQQQQQPPPAQKQQQEPVQKQQQQVQKQQKQQQQQQQQPPLPAEEKAEKAKKNKKKSKSEGKQGQNGTVSDGKEPDEGAWETKVSNREKRQQRKKEKGPGESDSPVAGEHGGKQTSQPVVTAPVSTKKIKDSLNLKAEKKEAVITPAPANWNTMSSVNSGGWNEMLKITPKVNISDGEKWSVNLKKSGHRNSEPLTRGQESDGSWTGMDGRIKPERNTVNFAMLGLNQSAGDPVLQSAADLAKWESHAPVDSEWSGFNGDSSSDWNAPSERWGNYEELKMETPAVQVAPVSHPPVNVSQLPDSDDDDKEKGDPSGTGKSKRKKKKKKKAEDENSALQVNSEVLPAPAESSTNKPRPHVPQEEPTKQNVIPPAGQKKNDQNWEPPKQVQKKKARRET